VLNYYLAHRPNVGGANVLGIGCATNETTLPSDLTNSLLPQIRNWLAANPTKRPQYVVLFPQIPARFNTNTTEGNYVSGDIVRPSIQYEIHFSVGTDWNPFITAINMNGFGGTNDCIAYIDKLEYFSTNYSPGQLIISASAGGYGNTNFILDNVRHDSYSNESYVVSDAISAITNANPNVSVTYLDGVETTGTNFFLPHITNAVNAAGYICWGQHSNWYPNGYDGYYSTNGAIKFTGASRWWIIRTEESYNGMRYVPYQGNILKWFSSYAFGGTNYSCTPIAAVSTTDEPELGDAAIDNAIYFGLWAGGKNFGICAWTARKTALTRFQAVGDPFVTR
jgi:hypothetical protein